MAAAGILKTVNPNPVTAGGFCIGHNDYNKSNEQVVLGITAVDLVAGTQLGKITATGLYVPIAPAANDGSQTWAGTLYGRRAANAATQRATIVARDQAIDGNMLTYVNAVSGPQKAVIEASMAAAMCPVRY